MVGRVQHSTAFKVRKWFSVFVWPVFVISYILGDKYQYWQLKTGRRKNLFDEFAFLQEAQIREQKALYNSPYGPRA
ncbi:hypothetical protein niasHS_004002 [Heterodera schachtii]|uniref:Uncharacterized protein n=2 Tax=Heterodera TaxID=34509 RepID=A0ABD2K4L7_HETSC